MNVGMASQLEKVAALGVRVGTKAFTLPEDCLLRIDRINKLIPYPGAPRFVLGVIIRDDTVYTVLKADILPGTPSFGDEIPSEKCLTGLFVQGRKHLPFVLAGEQAVSTTQFSSEQFSYFDLPSVCMADRATAPTKVAWVDMSL